MAKIKTKKEGGMKKQKTAKDVDAEIKKGFAEYLKAKSGFVTIFNGDAEMSYGGIKNMSRSQVVESLQRLIVKLLIAE